MMSHSLTQQQRRRDWNFWSSQKNKTIESFQIWQEYDVADDTKKSSEKRCSNPKNKNKTKKIVCFLHMNRAW